jgi:adenine-specific DNA-methyltransferase
MGKLIEENKLWWGESGNNFPRLKSFLAENQQGVRPQSLLFRTTVGDNQAATRELNGLFPDAGMIFDSPKPSSLIYHLAFVGNTKDDDIILDFFSGSATTAHAVMQLNAEDGGKRRHIMVQLPEPCDEKSEAFKAGYKTIAEIGKERIRRAGKKILSEWQAKQTKERPTQGDLLHSTSNIQNSTSPPDIGFRVLKIDSSNMADVYYQPDELMQDTLALHVDNLKPGRKPEDLLFQVLLDWGVDLALPVTEEKIKGRRVFFVADSGEPAAHPALAACFDTGLDEDFVKTLAKRAPLRAVFRDAGYASDAVKINIEQIFKALSPHTELKTL